MHVGNIKVLLVLVTMLISIAVGEVSVLVIGLVLSVYADEMRFQILFKERRQLVGMIKDIQQLSNEQMDKIVVLQQLNNKQTDKINKQMDKIIALQRVGQRLEDRIKEQTNKIETLRQLSKQQTNEIETLQGISQQVKNKVDTQISEIVALQRRIWQLRDKIKGFSLTGKVSFGITVGCGFLGLLDAFGLLDFIILMFR